MTGIEIFLEILARAGVSRIFGNPGSTELPLNEALTNDRRFQYVFGLHEIPVMAMADGYAMATGRWGVVNVHIACGLGNAMGMLYNAFREGTPLVLTAGQQDRRLRLGEPVLEGDLVSVARPWTKWAYEVARVEDVATATRRALQIALTPPTGPVFLALPLDLQTQPHPPGPRGARPELDLSPPSLPDSRVRPPLEAIEQAATLLRQAENPVILAGSRVTESGGVKALECLAEQLGAAVFAESTPSHGRIPISTDHPLARGNLPMWSDDMRRALEPFDVGLIVGMNWPRLYLHREPENPCPPRMRLIHLDNDPREIAKNQAIAVGLIGDPRIGLEELKETLARQETLACRQAADARIEQLARLRSVERERLIGSIEEQRERRPMTALTLMDALAKVLPHDVAVIEEAVTTHQNVFERLGVLHDPTAFFAHRGWALGWGLGCALGVKLAWPQRPVLGLIGDGAAMYGIQALWSAAHHRIPVTFVVANNSQYKILKDCGQILGLHHLSDPNCPGMDIIGPPVDFVGMARALGIDAVRVSEPEELSEQVRSSLTGDAPRLFEVPIAG